MSRLTIRVGDIEVEKPSGGGHGPTVPYYVELSLDGKAALHLTRFNFKAKGQMEDFIKLMEELLK